MTDSERVDAIRERHRSVNVLPSGKPTCYSCGLGVYAPCDAIHALDALDVAERERGEFRQLMLSEHNRANEQEEAKQRQWWRAKSAEAELLAARSRITEWQQNYYLACDERDDLRSRIAELEADRRPWWLPRWNEVPK